MDSQNQESSHETTILPQNAPQQAQNESLMAEESGMQQEPPMSTCTLEKISTKPMNETKDLSRPPSGSLTAELEEGPASKRLKMQDDTAAVSIAKPTAPPPQKPSVHIEVAPSVSIESSKGKPTTSSSSDVTPQATITSISEGSSEMSLEAKHTTQSRPSSTAQLPVASEPTKPAASAAVGGTSSSASSPTASSNKALHPPAASKPSAPSDKKQQQSLPIKSLTMMHLHKKYTAELEYMLREFRKLERQLLGAKGNGVEENAGSRERREKLHSFILHLENTLEQIQLGVRLEAEGKSTVMVGVTVGDVGGKQGDSKPTAAQVKQQLAESGALANLTKEKEEEENVQKLEEHILANLLPVKVRLKKQLAAQQGASRNPVGMPVARRGMMPSSAAEKGTGTFAAAAEKKRQQAEAAAAEDETQFGKPLTGGASSLTQKLHGQTLGSSKRKYGHGVGSAEPSAASKTSADGEPPQKRKILYAGMAPGSKQLKSGVSAASGAHKMIIETPALYPKSAMATTKAPPQAKPDSVASASVKPSSKPAALPQYARGNVGKGAPHHPGHKLVAKQVNASKAKKQKKQHDDQSLSEEERKNVKKARIRKKRRKLAQKRERERQMHIIRQQQQAPPVAQVPPKVVPGKKGKAAVKSLGKKKGPRTVEYICSLCSEVYSSTCDCNPWWALTHHDCPKCRKGQVPRVDITSPANAIEYHPALLAHAEEGANGGGSATSGPGVMHINPSHIPSSATFPLSRRYPLVPSDSDSDSDLSDLSEGDLSGDSLELDFDELENISALSPAEQAENELFGAEYDGPKLTDEESSRLLVLMSHASTCPGRHKQAKHRDVCSSVKYIMLHVRDCPGTTATFDICPFPWCRKVKHSLYHLVSCTRPDDCAVCSPKELSPNLTALVGLNEHRRKKQKERHAAAMVAAAAAAKAKPPPRAATKTTKPSATTKNAYKPPLTKPGAAKPGYATSAKKGPSPASSSSPRHPVTPKVPGVVSTQSAVATAAAAAAAAVRGSAGTTASIAANVPLAPAKSAPIPATRPGEATKPVGASKPPAVAKLASTTNASTVATTNVTAVHPAVLSSKLTTASAPVAEEAVAAAATSTVVTQITSPPSSDNTIAATAQPSSVFAASVVGPQKSVLAIAAEAAKLQAAASEVVEGTSFVGTEQSAGISSPDVVLSPPTIANPLEPTAASPPAAPLTTPAAAVKNEMEAAIRTAAQTAAAKPSPGLQPRIVTEESAAEAATFPELPAAVAAAQVESTSVPSNGESELAGIDSMSSETKFKVENVSPEKVTVESEAVAATVKGEESLLTESPPATIAVPASLTPAVKAEEEEHVTIEEKVGESSVEAAGGDRKGSVETAEHHPASEEKVQTPESTEMSRSSSCSDEVKKNEDVVRIGSC